ncbi:MAG TPA: hypothetical protein VII61_04870 [Ktedonobacteraceae bacterium]
MQNETQPPQPGRSYAKQFWLGIGLGSLPLVVALICIGTLLGSAAANSVGGILLIVSIVLYVVLFVAAIVCLTIRKVRFVGYGLLTMVIAIPVIAFIGCIVVIGSPNLHF